MVRCNHCDLIFVLPLWTDEVATKVFAQSKSTGWPGGITAGTASHREAALCFIARQIADRVPRGGRLLDIGCANGVFFDSMRSEAADWQFYGAEPDPKWQGFAYSEAQVSSQPQTP